MAMYDDFTDDQQKYKRVEVDCKNCTKFFGFLMRPVNEIFVGDFFCNLKCLSDYEDKMRRIKENITEKTLK